MNIDSNMETDRLLRRYARHRRDASTNIVEGAAESVENDVQGNHNSIAHLDPDELSTYAENALPAAARSRYTAHLADCDSCRKLITELVLSSGTVSALESHDAKQVLKEKRSWRDGLAAMFAQRVLRYAASIVVFLGVAAVALVVFRGGRDLKFGTSTSRTTNQDADVSKNQSNTPSQPNTSNVPPSEPAPGDKSKPDASTGSSTEVNRDLPVGVQTEAQKSVQEQGEAKPPPPASVPSDIVAEERGQSTDKDSSVAAKQQPVLSGASGPKIDAKKEVDGADSRAREGQRRNEAEGRANSEGASASVSKTPSSADESASKRKARRSSETPPKNAPPQLTMDDRVERVDKSGSGTERRTVNGKQFVRREGAWVDSAYRSQATTNVKRGSDQYRALLADEPGLRSIANQLGGEVVVVWNGRAYRIH